tara:strand:- start:16756 stop:17313 length:558 start_codon:yes stop_codon:yes gene_type:complete
MIEKDTTTKKIYTVKYNELTTYAVEVRGASSSKQAIDFVRANGGDSDGEEGVSSGQQEYCNGDITGNFKSSVERVRQCKGVGMAFKSQGNPDDYWVRTCYEEEVAINEPVAFSVFTDERGWGYVQVDYNGFCGECNRRLHSNQEDSQRHEMTLLKSDGHLGHYWRINGTMRYPCGFPEDEKEASQ